MSLSVEWGWLSRAPKLRKFVEPDVRVRPDQPDRLVNPGQRRQTGGHHRVSLSRLSPHLGFVARAGRDALDGLERIGRGERIEMVQKYAHLAPTHLAYHAENVKITSMSAPKTKQPPLLAAVGT
ncbi:hypothetical protein D3C85_537900 [compost metagenome]